MRWLSQPLSSPLRRDAACDIWEDAASFLSSEAEVAAVLAVRPVSGALLVSPP